MTTWLTYIFSSERIAFELMDLDLETNVNAFNKWYQAYKVSPRRDLPAEDAEILDKIVHPAYKGTHTFCREQLTPKALAVVELWEKEPLERNTPEWRQARIRMIRKMILDGELEMRKREGLTVSRREFDTAARGIYIDCMNKGKYTWEGELESYSLQPEVLKLKELMWNGYRVGHLRSWQCWVNDDDGCPDWKKEYDEYCQLSRRQKRNVKRQAKRVAKHRAREKAAAQTQGNMAGANLSLTEPKTQRRPSGDSGSGTDENEAGANRVSHMVRMAAEGWWLDQLFKDRDRLEELKTKAKKAINGGRTDDNGSQDDDSRLSMAPGPGFAIEKHQGQGGMERNEPKSGDDNIGLDMDDDPSELVDWMSPGMDSDGPEPVSRQDEDSETSVRHGRSSGM
ncbi:MAG: hypothetical protein Q9213_003643 [Squamulea squamosa]